MFIVCFDLTNKQSFEHVRKWEKKLRALGVNVKGKVIIRIHPSKRQDEWIG